MNDSLKKVTGRDPGRQPRHFVYLLLDENQDVRYVGTGQYEVPSRWRTIWRYRDRLTSELAAWFRTLEREPAEQIVLGASVPLDARTASMARDMMTNWFPAAIREPRIVGGYGKVRAISHVGPDGRVRAWRSRQEAAEAAGVSRPAIVERLRLRSDWIDGDLT